MPTNLKRYYGKEYVHFITFSCYRRQPYLGTPAARDIFLNALEQARGNYKFFVNGYVLMPEHVHLLVRESKSGNLSMVLQVLKQVSSRKLHQAGLAVGDVWQRRWYDFNVFTTRKHVEKLRYMHRNPVKRGLVESPEEWPWSSFRWYLYREAGLVTIED